MRRGGVLRGKQGYLSGGRTHPPSLTPPVPPPAAAGDVQYNSAANYSLTLRVTDGAGLFDTAAVLVSIIDTNDAASWVGTYLPSGAAAPTTAAYGPPTPQLSVSEAAPVGTVFGRVLATDPNREAVWGARIYALVASADARFFAINASSGELRVGAAGAAFWDQPTFFLVVTVQDADPVAPLVVPYNVSVQLLQVNTVAVTGYAVPNGTSPLAALNASGAATSPLYSGVVTPTLDVLVTTRGFASLLVLGGGFGRTAARLAREGVALTPAGIAAATPITASLGAWNQPPAAWAPVSCVVTVPNSVLTCALPPGTAANLSLAISVAGWPAASPRVISYMPPSITAAASVSGLPLLTEGTDSVTLQGDNFGPIGTAPLVSYAPNASSLPLLYAPLTPCVVTVAHTTMICPTLPGVGTGLVFSVAVAGQAAVPGLFRPSPPVRYRTPAITAVAAPVLQTAGGEAAAIDLNGAWGGRQAGGVLHGPAPHPHTPPACRHPVWSLRAPRRLLGGHLRAVLCELLRRRRRCHRAHWRPALHVLARPEPAACGRPARLHGARLLHRPGVPADGHPLHVCGGCWRGSLRARDRGGPHLSRLCSRTRLRGPHRDHCWRRGRGPLPDGGRRHCLTRRIAVRAANAARLVRPPPPRQCPAAAGVVRTQRHAPICGALVPRARRRHAD